MSFEQLVARWRDMVETDYSFIVQAIRMGGLCGHEAIEMVKAGR